MNEIMTISGVECYEQDGVAYRILPGADGFAALL